MPYDSSASAYTGPEARAPRETARSAFMAVLRARLNDPQGPYFASLSLSPQRKVVLSESRSTISEQFKESKPVVYVVCGPEVTPTTSGSLRRHQVTLLLDLGVLAANDKTNPNAQEKADGLLAGYVTDAVRTSRAQFKAVGLSMVTIKPGGQDPRAAQMRNPHTVMLWMATLDG